LSTQEEEDEGIIIEKPNKTNKQNKEHAYNTYVIHRNVNCSTHGKKVWNGKSSLPSWENVRIERQPVDN
jgi:hypothetical protein